MRAPITLVISLAVALSAHALTWSTHGPNGGAITTVDVAPSDPHVVYVANGSGIFRSPDAGDSWMNVSGSLTDVSQLAIDPLDANIVYVATPTGAIWKTSNGGASWRNITDGLPSGVLPSALRIDPRDPRTLYLASHCPPIGFKTAVPTYLEAAGVYKSIDGGASWKQMLNGLTGRPFAICVEELSLDPADSDHLFAAPVYTDGGFSESYDAANAWMRAPGSVPSRQVVAAPNDPLNRFGITSRITTPNVPLVSNDGGKTWRTAGGKGLPQGYDYAANDIDIDQTTGRLFLASAGGVFRSGDGGENWVQLGNLQTAVSRIVVDEGAGVLFAATTIGLWRAPLATFGPWTPLPVGESGTRVTHLATDPHRANVVYAVTDDYYDSKILATHGRLFRSTDFGASWTWLDTTSVGASLGPIAVDAEGKVIVLAGALSSRMVWRYDPDTAAATRLNATLPYAQFIVAHPERTNYLYAPSVAGGLLVSRDGGRTWVGTDVSSITKALSFDPTHPDVVYAADRKATWRSTDAGVTWTAISPIWTDFVAVAPSRPSTIYRLTLNPEAPGSYGALWRSDDSGANWTRLRWPGELGTEQALVVDPRDHRSLWILSAYEPYGLQHSADGGVTWTKVMDNLPHLPSALVIDRAGVMLHAAVTGAGVWEAQVMTRRRVAGR